jgi:hypothetical protein
MLKLLLLKLLMVNLLLLKLLMLWKQLLSCLLLPLERFAADSLGAVDAVEAAVFAGAGVM